MDRIVIIGNGFDLAHDLKTSYGHFLGFLLESITKSSPNNNPDKWICTKFNTYDLEYNLSTNSSSKSIFFKSLFNRFNKDRTWADFEAHYFYLIKRHFKSADNIKLINEEFEHLKNILEEYLTSQVENNITKSSPETIESSPIFNLLKTSIDREVDRTLVVSFNYTKKLLQQYLNYLRIISNEHIWLPPNFVHGCLKCEENPIIFGYGDENSDEYKDLERLESNEALRNFKTFQYLRTSNYIGIQNFLENNKKKQVQIIGHSCGLTDKALLRSIFQHPSVLKIEYHYHESPDNYFQNAINISRMFDDNHLLRNRLLSLDVTRKI